MNNSIDITNGSQIENLVTKFFYKNNRLHYQILIYRTDKQKFLYKTYDDYNLYKSTYDALLNAQHAQLPIDFLKEDLVLV